jgi:glycosyltransferase involved in cell wall biosynthesis
VRYLFGPVDRLFAERNLAEEREAGRCLTFGPAGACDLAIGAGDSWPDIEKRLPEGWKPDCIVLHLEREPIPEAIWQAPIPIVGIVGECEHSWHAYRSLLRRCDIVLADEFHAEKLRLAGLANVRAASLNAVGSCQADGDDENQARDIDVLVVGNGYPVVSDETQQCLRRVVEAIPHRKVVFATSNAVEKFAMLARRSRIVVNCGNWSAHCAEAVALGALVFQKSAGSGSPENLRAGGGFAAFDPTNVETLLHQYLADDSTAKALARQVKSSASEEPFSAQLRGVLELVAELPAPSERQPLDYIARTWVALSGWGEAPRLLNDIGVFLESHPRSSRMRHLQATLLASKYQRPDDFNAIAEAYQLAWKSDPRNVVAGLCLAETLWRMRLKAEATEQCERTLAMISLGEATDHLELPPYPVMTDRMFCEWEQAAWNHAGNVREEIAAKLRLLRWRLQMLLAETTGDLHRAFAAVLERPDLPESRVRLGELLFSAGKPAEAAEHLLAAFDQQPFHPRAASLAYQAFVQTGQTERHVRLASTQRLLSEAAPQFVATEAWTRNAGLLSTEVRPNVDLKVSIGWEGDFAGVASLAGVNRNLCRALLARGHSVTLFPKSIGIDQPFDIPEALHGAIANEPGARDQAIQVHVAHQWPPQFVRPKAGRWVLMQPWEFGSIPKAWIEPIRRNVDEVWVPSRFVRNCFVNSGIPAEKVHVVPNGFSPHIVGDRSKPYPLQTSKRFKFLFVGGTIPRKGIDLLLAAYGQIFDASDDVCLVIKEMGKGTFYRGQTADNRIAEFRQRANAPTIELIEGELSESEMASLYSASDCLVHPFRGEGFGLPILEAMANGLPTIVTGFGPVLDFCNADTSYLLPAKAYHLAERRVGEIETVDLPFLAEADQDALAARMRHVVDHPEEACAKGEVARRIAHEHFTWEHAANAVEKRLASLVTTKTIEASSNDDFGPGSVSLCLIVKNEEKNLGPCLNSVRGLVSEIVLVDTGSLDRTKEIAAEFGARVFEFPWIDDFAAARNETLRHARGEWILWMDADDRIDVPNQAKLRELIQQLDGRSLGYVMKCRCLPDHDTGTTTIVDHVRLFRRHPQIRWKYRIHEQILPSIRSLGGDVAWSDVIIDHVGYQDAAVRSRKLQRDLRLLELENRDVPDDPFTLFNLGSVYQELDRTPQALEAFRRSLSRSHSSDSIVRKLYALIAQCERQLGTPSKALEACQEGRGHYPSDPEILFQEGLARAAIGDVAGAEACYLAAMAPEAGRHFASIDVGIRSYKARHNLAVLYRDHGRNDEAEGQWQAAIQEAPSFLPAWSGLADLFLCQGFREKARSLIDRMPIGERFDAERERMRRACTV